MYLSALEHINTDMLRGVDTSLLFDSYINSVLQKYAVERIFTEASKKSYDEDDEDRGEDDDDDDFEYETPITGTKLAVDKPVEVSNETKFNDLYPEPLEHEDVVSYFKIIDDGELNLLKALCRVKFSTKKIIDTFSNLIAGKLSISEIKHRKEEGGYRRWFSAEEYLRYIRYYTPKLIILFNEITDLSKDLSNSQKILSLKNEILDIVSRVKINQVLLNNITDETINFLNQQLTREDDILEDTWIAKEKLQVLKDYIVKEQNRVNKSKNEIQLHNMRLVARIAIDVKDTLAVLGFERSDFVGDLVGAGIEGLMLAVDKFDYTRENKFSTAAVPYIRGAIRAYCYRENIVKMPFDIITKISKIRKAQRILKQQVRGEPAPRQIAEFLAKTEKKFHPSVQEVTSLLEIGTSSVSIETPVGEYGEETLGSKMADVNALIPGSEQADVLNFQNKISKIRKHLTPQENIAVNNLFKLDEYNIERFKHQIISVRKHLLNMKKQLNDSFDNEVNKFLSLYLEFTTTAPVNAITNVGKQAMVFDPSEMTGKKDCPVSRAAYEMYKMNNKNADAIRYGDWDTLTDEQRGEVIGRIKEAFESSNKLTTSPSTRRPIASPNQQTQPSSKITAIGAI